MLLYLEFWINWIQLEGFWIDYDRLMDVFSVF